MEAKHIRDIDHITHVLNQVLKSLETGGDKNKSDRADIQYCIGILRSLPSAASVLGSIKTETKANSSRKNGKKGGRPQIKGLKELAETFGITVFPQGGNWIISYPTNNGYRESYTASYTVDTERKAIIKGLSHFHHKMTQAQMDYYIEQSEQPQKQIRQYKLNSVPTPTHQEVCEDYNKWVVYVDPTGIDTEEDFNQLTLAEKMEIVTKSFGTE